MAYLNMGSIHPTGRPVTMGLNGMVAAPNHLASAAGFSMLLRGGSAVDAIIATNAVLAVVYPHMAGLGGDLFAQVWEPGSGKVAALNGSGRSGEKVTPDFYIEKGWEEIKARGPLAAITVPGAVHAWWELHQKYGKLEWRELFRPAIHYASKGYPLSQKFRDFISQYSDVVGEFEETAKIYLLNGRPPQAGTILRQTDLAKSINLVAEKGMDVFYRGEIAEKIVRGLQDSGGLLTEDDFASHQSDWVEPLHTNYRGYEVYQLPPNTQGIATLMILNLLEEMDLKSIGEGTADYYHLMTEAVKLVFADRDRWVTDPDSIDIPIDKLLSKDYTSERRQHIDMEKALNEEQINPAIDRGDTVYLCAHDKDGMAVSLIQSVYFEFGSAFISPGTGILLQNRGSFFSLDSSKPNVLAPRKRTFHTIIPAIVLRNGKPALLFGTMGGEGQPQTQAAMLTRIVDFGFNVQEAIEAPRWLYGRTWGEESKSLKLEARIPDGIIADLLRRGHDVELVEHWSQTMGHAQAIWVDQEQGVLHGGADPRGEGAAIGW
jgi:gamma-glutamyltranspeptidase